MFSLIWFWKATRFCLSSLLFGRALREAVTSVETTQTCLFFPTLSWATCLTGPRPDFQVPADDISLTSWHFRMRISGLQACYLTATGPVPKQRLTLSGFSWRRPTLKNSSLYQLSYHLLLEICLDLPTASGSDSLLVIHVAASAGILVERPCVCLWRDSHSSLMRPMFSGSSASSPSSQKVRRHPHIQHRAWHRQR